MLIQLGGSIDDMAIRDARAIWKLPRQERREIRKTARWAKRLGRIAAVQLNGEVEAFLAATFGKTEATT